jgi:hypothetical protein
LDHERASIGRPTTICKLHVSCLEQRTPSSRLLKGLLDHPTQSQHRAPCFGPMGSRQALRTHLLSSRPRAMTDNGQQLFGLDIIPPFTANAFYHHSAVGTPPLCIPRTSSAGDILETKLRPTLLTHLFRRKSIFLNHASLRQVLLRPMRILSFSK